MTSLSSLNDPGWILALRADEITPVFKGLTDLGSGAVVFSIIALGLWLWRPAAFARIGVAVGVTILLNAAVKAAFDDPRPDPSLWLVQTRGHGFPSGHAQLAVVLWGALAIELRRPWAVAACALVAFGISFSRLYLGVHDVGDVAGGALLGLATLVALELARRHVPARAVAVELAALAAVAAAGLLAYAGDHWSYPVSGAAFMLAIHAGARAAGDYTPPVTWPERAAVAALGLAGLLAVRLGGRELLARAELTHPAFAFAHVAAIAGYISYAVPRATARLSSPGR